MDRISFVHDPIRSQILSHLPIDDAIRTKILSKQWQNLFLLPQQIVFYRKFEKTEDLYLKQLKGIANFIDKALPLQTFPTITKYEIRLEGGRSSNFSLSNKGFHDLGIKAAISKHVKEIIVRVPNNWSYFFEKNYDIILLLCSYSSLERLTIEHSNFKIESSTKICWTSLKALTLKCIQLYGDVMTNILEGCPKLENLELNQCSGFSRIDTGLRSCLRRLVIIQYQTSARSDYESMVSISVPTVKCLILKVLQRLQLMDVSSLVDVSVDFHYMNPDTYLADNKMNRDNRPNVLFKILNKVGHAETVRLGPWCVKVLSINKNIFPSILLPNCKCLVMESWTGIWDIRDILSLLRILPHLETLVIDLTSIADDHCREQYCNGINALNTKSYGEVIHLKNVRIVGLCSWIVDIAGYLLQNVKSLEKMKLIKSNKIKCDQSVIIENILKLPRASPNTRILY